MEGAVATPLHQRAWSLLSDHAVVLAGYDHGYEGAADLALRVAAIVALAAVAWAAVRGRSAASSSPALRAVLWLALVNVVVAVTALPHIPGNPRYLLFSILTVAVLLARLAAERWGRPLLAALVIAGAVGSWAQAPGTLRADAQWRRFVADLRGRGRAVVLHGFLPGHQDQLPLRRARRLLGEARAHHHRVFLRLSIGGGRRPRGGAHRGEHDRRPRSWSGGWSGWA